MIRRIVLVLAATLASSGQSAPLQFDEVASIVHADAKTAFAGIRVNTYMPDASLIGTIEKFIEIPGEEAPARSGHYAMIDGCRLRSCIEKAAVLVDMRSRTIAGVALRNYECRHVVPDDSASASTVPGAGRQPAVRCNDEPILDLYVVRRSGKSGDLQDERQQLARLRKWGSNVGHQGERVQIVARHHLR